MDSEQVKKCTRNGCKQNYYESKNTQDACHFHPGKPIFHDLKKGWTCCNVIVFDWDEFEKIKTCATGQHTDVGAGVEFFQSSTVSNAQKALDKDTNQVKPQSIDDYNKKIEKEKEIQKLIEDSQPKKIFVTPNGNYKCINKGCQKDYNPNDNTQITDESCHYHPGNPIFHDLKKYWTCCKKETYDWDDFMKLPTCAKGPHQPKLA